MTGTPPAKTNQLPWLSSFKKLAWVETRTYLRDPAAVFWTFLYPTILLVVMMALFGAPEAQMPSFEADVVARDGEGWAKDAAPGYSRSTYYVIGLTVLTIVSTALFGFTGPLIALRAEGGLKLFQVMPIRRISFTLGYASCRVLILLVFAFFYIYLGMAIYGAERTMSLGNWLLIMFLVALSSAAFLSLGMAVAGVVTKINTANTLMHLVNIPIMFLSDLFIPISLMPDSIESVARYSPVFMLADSMRQVAAGTAGLAECWLTILYLAVLAVIGTIFAAFSFRWNL